MTLQQPSVYRKRCYFLRRKTAEDEGCKNNDAP